MLKDSKMQFPFHADAARALTEKFAVPQPVIDKIVTAIKLAAQKGRGDVTVSVDATLDTSKLSEMLLQSGYNVHIMKPDATRMEPYVSVTVQWKPKPIEIGFRTKQVQPDWVDPEGVGQYRG